LAGKPQIKTESIDPVYHGVLEKSHPLTSVEEARLAIQIREGDLKARDQLVKANLRFVVRVAFMYRNSGIPLDDLIGAGNVGLIEAAERFDESRGFRFISYAVWWIRRCIRQAITEQNQMISIPESRLNKVRRIKEFSETYQDQTGQLPNVKAIGDAFDLDSAKVSDLASSNHQVFFL